LPGITRNTIVQLAQDLSIPVVETIIPREMLYIADEVFFAGTATEITPIRSIDRQSVGRGVRGEITTRLQAEYMAAVQGEKPNRHGWLTHVPALETAGVRRT
jgi:branched-chain amino acid aminotransferase